MSLMTAAAAILTIVGMAAAVVRRGCSPILAAAAVASGAIMLAELVLPGFSGASAAGVTLALLPPVLGAILWRRIQTRRQLTGLQKTAAVLAVVDIGFMALTMFLMPDHASGHLEASAPQMGSTSGHATHMTAGAGLMSAFVLIGWMACAAVVAVPAMRRHTRRAIPHASCSACMILAMAVMGL